MTVFRTQKLGGCLGAIFFTMTYVITAGSVAMAVEAGQPAPAFTLPSTAGRDISLSDFRGKKWVLLEFYGADFVPT